MQGTGARERRRSRRRVESESRLRSTIRSQHSDCQPLDTVQRLLDEPDINRWLRSRVVANGAKETRVTEAEGSTTEHGAGAAAARGADAGALAGQRGAGATAGNPPRADARPGDHLVTSTPTRADARPGDDAVTSKPTRVGAGPGDNIAGEDLPRAGARPGGGVAAGRALRADARRNRARVLEAAEAAFASKGTSVSTEEIARDAGVGIGTVFRHFPTKEALLEAVVVGRLERLAAEAASLATAEDPGSAFFSFFASAVDRSATKIALADALAAAGVDVERAAAEVGRELRRTMGVLLGRAQAVGAVREDATVADVIALLVGASRAAEHAGWDRGVQTRTVAIMLDGLRPAAGR